MTELDAKLIFGPATELGSSWVEALRRRFGAATISWSDATHVAGRLLEGVSARLQDQKVELPFHELWAESSPEIEEIIALRPLFRERAAARLPPAQAMTAVGAANDVIDELLGAVIRAQVDVLESAAFLDPLTGVGNRRSLQRDLKVELARSFRHGRPLAVAAIDVDGLKVINDTRGHAAGDEALKRLANTLGDTLRVSDAVYRVGGDEFVVLMPETAAEDVRPLLVRAMSQAPPFSFGVAAAPVDATSADALLALADAQLIEGRRQRRAEPEPASDGEEERPGSDGAPSISVQEHEASVSQEVAPGPLGGERVRIQKILAVTSERVLTVEVTMRHGDRTLSGRATGTSAAAARRRIVAAATLDAASSLDADLASTFIEGVSVLRVGETEIAVVNLVIVGSVEETSTGAAQVRHRGTGDAVARAVLDALNRRLCMRARPQVGAPAAQEP